MKNYKPIRAAIAVLCAVCLLLGAVPLTASAAEQPLNATDVTIYALDEAAQAAISIPGDYPQSFTFAVDGASEVSCRASFGSDLEVEGTTVSPQKAQIYWYGGWGYYSPIQGKTPDCITNTIAYGDQRVEIVADGKTYYATVHVVDYADIYARTTAQTYLDENIRGDMTTKEKAEVIAKFVADRDYSPYYSTFTDMMVFGCGDCWASSYTIVEMAKMIGLDAWVRNGNRDYGAGSGHRNAMVTDGVQYYEVEAGYSGMAPRSYEVRDRESLFSFHYDRQNEGYEVYQYDGKVMPEKLEVPAVYRGEPVVSVGAQFICTETAVREVVLPDSIKKIGMNAFESCTALTTINIPPEAEAIEPFAFADCTALQNVTATGRIQYRNNAFILDGTVLLEAAVTGSSYTVPEGITELQRYAFAYTDLTELNMASTVKTIGEGCFYNSNALKTLRLNNGVTAIGNYALTNTAVTELTCPRSLTEFGDKTAEGLAALTLYGYKDSAAQAFAEAHDNVTFVALPEVLPGDVDLDGAVTIQDCTVLQRYLGEMTTLSQAAQTAADVNGDGMLNVRDVTGIARMLAAA